jgi:hypothetical protein
VAEHLTKVLYDDMASRRCLDPGIALATAHKSAASKQKTKIAGKSFDHEVDSSPQEQIDRAFREAVWMLHGKIFRTYNNWAESLVALPTRPSEDQHVLDRHWAGMCFI